MTAMFSFDTDVPYGELADPPLPSSVREIALACFAAQRAALAALRPAGPSTASAEDAAAAVSADTLERLIASGRTTSGVVAQRELATAIPFNARHTRDAVWNGDVAAQRRRLDAAVGHWLPTLFAAAEPPLATAAGHWWYPPGTSFGWHTNQTFPGWRLYLSYAEEAGRSYFRYRHPTSGAVLTSTDSRWHLRFFEVSAERLFWHAIYSDTDRFSVGWVVRPWSLRNAAAARLAKLLRR